VHSTAPLPPKKQSLLPTKPSVSHTRNMPAKNVQTYAVRFISNIKGRTDIWEEIKRLCLEPLDLRRKSRRISLLLKILFKEEQHPTLSAAYNDFLDQRTTSTVLTRSQVSGFPRSVRVNKNGYLYSFLPKTIRYMKISTVLMTSRAVHNCKSHTDRLVSLLG